MTFRSITPEYAREVLAYDPETGTFTWKPRPKANKSWNTQHSGKKAGTTGSWGYVYIQMGKRNHVGAQILAWMIMTGEHPKHVLDHRDGDRGNNRWGNIREAPDGANSINKAMQRNNTSGFVGVHFNAQNGKWRATVNRGKVRHDAGFFDSAEAAAKARTELAIKIHGEFVVVDPSNRKRFAHQRDSRRPT